MDELMKPCLDYDDNENEEDLGLLLAPTLAALKDPNDDPVEYGIEKYFSNGDIDRGAGASAVFGKRVGKRSNMRRYSDDADDLIGGVGPGTDHYRIVRRDSTDSDEEEFARGGDEPLSLEELDGWMSSINKYAKDDSVEIIPPEEEVKDSIPDAVIEAEYLRRELEDL